MGEVAQARGPVDRASGVGSGVAQLDLTGVQADADPDRRLHT
jgi:hypothetical protein